MIDYSQDKKQTVIDSVNTKRSLSWLRQPNSRGRGLNISKSAFSFQHPRVRGYSGKQELSGGLCAGQNIDEEINLNLKKV